MKKIHIIFLLFITLILSGCSTGGQNTYTDTLDKVLEELTIETELTNDQLPTLIEGVEIEWEASDNNSLTSDFKVKQGTEDKNVTLTAYLFYSGRMLTKSFDVVIKKIDLENIDYEGYYEGAGDLSGDALKAFLHNLIDDHNELSYGDLRDALQVTDEDPNNPDNIILLYTGESVPSRWDSGNTWNREHVWPRSLGGMIDGDAEFSDLHHLRPADPGINSTRGNKVFDEGGSSVGGCDGCFQDSDSFEPNDDVKGDIARMIFYMVVRYEGENGEADLELVDSSNVSSPNIGVLSTLLKWHQDDPVDEWERQRNDLIYSYQGNRNPFIDHPEFVLLIFGE